MLENVTRRDAIRTTAAAFGGAMVTDSIIIDSVIADESGQTDDNTDPTEIISAPYDAQIGDVVGDKAFIWSQRSEPARMYLHLSTQEDFSEKRIIGGPAALAASNYTATIDIDGLPRGEVISYQVVNEGTIELQEQADTFAEGIKTRTPFALPLQIMQNHLTEMMLVEDDDLRAAIYRLLADDSVLAEGAAAAGVAAALQLGDELADKTLVLPITGSNLAGRTFTTSLHLLCNYISKCG